MKSYLLAMAFVAFAGCTTEREIQADMVDAKLVKVEEVNRYPNTNEKIFTWQTTNNITYITFAPLTTNIPIGTFTKVLVRR